ncbi:hypothetical protein J4439_06255 [Candidatus Woesearchaeota archaeon]|nr:hypothetical protein [Candidatus Woesearchaeota archaeon]
MQGYLTYCFSDWLSESFRRAPMRIRDGKRTDVPLRTSLEDLVEGEDYYVKADPDFDALTYRVCHRRLRERIQPGDYLFFRTNHCEQQYVIGYFRIQGKEDSERGPILHGDRADSLLLDFRLELSPQNWDVVQRLNPRAQYHPERSINLNLLALGRNYLLLDEERTVFLRSLCQSPGHP